MIRGQYAPIPTPVKESPAPSTSGRVPYSKPSIIQMSPPSGLKRSNRTKRPSGDQLG